LHADYRKLLNREFTPRSVARMEAAVRAIVGQAFDALAEPAADHDVVDLVEAVALPVPVAVIAELLGMGEQDMGDVRRWSDATIEVSDNPSEQVLADVTEFAIFLNGHVRQRFDAPGDDLASRLLAAEVDGRRLEDMEFLLFFLLLVDAGGDTTRNLLSGALLALWEHPDQRAALAADPSLVPGAVEECLRWVTPIQAFARTATVATDVGGAPLPADAFVIMLYASANRDETTFGPTADAFDVTRPVDPPHLSFGFGEHLCLGAALARMEARIFLTELLARTPEWDVTGTPDWAPSTLVRGMRALPVRRASMPA
jgi:cytochrome P450